MTRRQCSVAVSAIALLAAVAFPYSRPAAQTPPELIIRRATIVNADGRTEGDIRIRGEKIAEIGRNLAPAAGAREIDATGLIVLPGGVDPHVHPIGSQENLTTASAAALAGGATTISHFVSPAVAGQRGATADEDFAGVVRRTDELIKKDGMADFIVHVMMNNPEKQIDQLAGLVKSGQPSIKIFMDRAAFADHERGYIAAIRKAGELGIMSLIHCEDWTLINEMGQRFTAQGKGDIKYFAEARPVVTEEAATQRCVSFSETTGAPVYIVHISSERALRAAEAGRARGLPIFTEVRFIYLFLTDEVYKRDDLGLYIGRPPYRKQTDVDYLWKGISQPHRGRRRHRSFRVHEGREADAADGAGPQGGHERPAGLHADRLGSGRQQEAHHRGDIRGDHFGESRQADGHLSPERKNRGRIRRRHPALGSKGDENDSRSGRVVGGGAFVRGGPERDRVAESHHPPRRSRLGEPPDESQAGQRTARAAAPVREGMAGRQQTDVAVTADAG